ncbi:MAG: CHASE4 domain-containing protein [Desulfuromonas sp.]|nr:CHASE4 domain-containing protein [Desulfuromonas sp.]
MAWKSNINTLLILLVLLFIVSALTIAIVAYRCFIVPSYAELEKENATHHAHRVAAGIDHEIDSLDRITKDYAHWNDTVDYVQNNDTTYLSSNYLNQMLEDNHLNFVAIYDTKDNLRYMKNYDLVASLERPPHAAMFNDVLTIFNNSSQNGLKGVWRENGKLQLVAVRSIKRSDGLGKTYGTVIFSRPMDTVLSNNLSRQFRLDVDIRPIYAPNDEPLLAKVATGHSVSAKPLDNNHLGAYFPLLDLNQQVVAVAQIAVPRQTYLHTKNIILFSVSGAVVTIICLALLLLVKIRQVLLRPVKKLTNALHQIRQADEETLPSGLLQDCAIGGLVHECNGLIADLAAWKAKHNYTRENSDLLKRVVPSAIFTVDNNKVITSWNQRAQLLTGYSSQEMIGRSCFLFAKEPCQESCGLFDKADGEPIIGRECTIRHKNGSTLTISKNADYLRDETGAIVGGIECFEDISRRKLFEDALHWEVALNSRLAMLAQSILQCGCNEGQVAEELLDYARNLTGSSHGFVAERVGDDQQVVWSATSLFDNLEVHSGLKTIFALASGRGSLLHAVYDSSSGVFFNSLDKLQGISLTGGVTNGIINFMAVPVNYGDRIIGQVALANNEQGYSKKDLQAIAQLAELFALVLTHLGRRQKIHHINDASETNPLAQNFA